MLKQIKIKIIFHYTRYGARLRVIAPGNTDPFGGMSTQRWQAVGNTVSNLTGPRFEPQISRSRDERVTARPNESQINYCGTADDVASNASVSHNTG